MVEVNEPVHENPFITDSLIKKAGETMNLLNKGGIQLKKN